MKRTIGLKQLALGLVTLSLVLGQTCISPAAQVDFRTGGVLRGYFISKVNSALSGAIRVDVTSQVGSSIQGTWSLNGKPISPIRGNITPTGQVVIIGDDPIYVFGQLTANQDGSTLFQGSYIMTSNPLAGGSADRGALLMLQSFQWGGGKGPAVSGFWHNATDTGDGSVDKLASFNNQADSSFDGLINFANISFGRDSGKSGDAMFQLSGTVGNTLLPGGYPVSLIGLLAQPSGDAPAAGPHNNPSFLLVNGFYNPPTNTDLAGRAPATFHGSYTWVSLDGDPVGRTVLADGSVDILRFAPVSMLPAVQ